MKAAYVDRDLRVKYSFWLFDFQDKFEPLSTNRNHPKFHRLFRTIVNPVGAFYRIKFGQFDGKIEVRSQHMLIAIDLCCLLTFNFSSNLAKFDAVKAHRVVFTLEVGILWK